MLVIKQAQALAMKLNNPARVLETIPTAKMLTVRGVDMVITPHKLDEVRVLRNLGINAPSPISHYYKWPGRYVPFDHQKETAAFLTVNQRGLVLNEIGCVDADTEYLSIMGWKRIADYDGGAVAQYWPDKGKIDFVESPEYVKLPCEDMIRFKTRYGVDQLLSPEHRVLYVSSTGKPMVDNAANILVRHESTKRGWSGRIITTFSQADRTGIPLTDDELLLQVAVMAAGHFGASTKRCVVRLKRKRKIYRLRQLLANAFVAWRETDSVGYKVFTFKAPMREKSYGEWAWAASNEQLRFIADEVAYWDGTSRKAGATEFFTRDKPSADFVQYAFAATGRTASLSVIHRDSGTDYVVHARDHSALLYVKGYGDNGKSEAIYPEKSTDGFKYCFMVPSTFLLLRRNGCIFATGNTGKTQSALWAADYLIDIGQVKKVLILSPLSTLERVWSDAIFTQFHHRKSVVLYGTAERRRRLLHTEADFYICNHDGFGIIAEEAKGMFDLVIVDEAAVLRNPFTRRFKIVRNYMKASPNARLWLMTGTPTPNDPTDAWALAKLVDSPMLTSTYTNFKEQVMMKLGMYRSIPRPESVEIVKNILQPSVRYTRDECFDLPDTVYQTRRVPLSAEQKGHFAKMMKELITDAAQGTISAVNEAVKMQKLIQISCGVAYGEAGQCIELDCSARVRVVEEIIEEVGGKVIVFVPLTGTLHMLERELKKRWTVGVVNGQVSSSARNVIFNDFQNAKDPKVLLAHPATMAHGLTLTSASTIIWYGPIASNEQYVQANGRIERIGKRHVSNVIHIECTDLEHKVYERLKNKQALQGLLLDLIQQQTR